MIGKVMAGVFIVLLTACKTETKSVEVPNYPTQGLQLILVTTPEWNSTAGTMQLLERKDLNATWKIIDSFEIVVGRNGLAWDEKNSIYENNQGPVKREGDGCAPAGVFTLGTVFSYHKMENIKMPFIQVNENDLCVDDANSKYYNTLINKNTVAENDFNSFEFMKREDEQYEYGIWVNYNTDPQIPGNGSCIFLHIYKTPNTPTSGCTAMKKEHMLTLINWLDASKNPMLMQLTDLN